jgi:two-component system, NarL family, invasion response regulator UvrY
MGMASDEAGKDRIVRVLVVDDQVPFRQAAKAVCEVTPGVEVVGEAASGEEAVDLADELDPDIVLMDYRLPGMDGLAATRAITTAHPQTRVLLLSTYPAEDIPGDVRDAGAVAYVHKEAFGPDVLEDLVHSDAA